ncbi:MAG TPA: endonuclease MutS2 [Bacillota bacterium]|jgi:DNA mismatch repair protein MutS2
MMDERILRALEFDKIREHLVDEASCSLGRDIAAALAPSGDVGVVRRWQSETTEARDVLARLSSVPLGGLHDIRPHLGQAERGALLTPPEFLEIADTIHASRRLKRFFADDRLKAPVLAEMAAGLGVFDALEAEIKRVITDQGEVADNASPELARIRRARRTLQGRIRDKLDSIIRSAEHAKYLQDPIITIRGDRYVVPVKQEFRGQFSGVIHDQSSSGATLFIEPMAVVELNNDLRQEELRERDEVQRILRLLTARLAGEAEPLRASLELMARLDFAFAKGKLSLEMRATEPFLNATGRLEIHGGRHPLLLRRLVSDGAGGSGEGGAPREVVPIDVPLGKDFDTLVITGPNTGGKTVTLKTIGLLTLMAQAGLHVPAADGTELSVFAKVFCDIGDEQSIEQSLSTFSSHMRNIVALLRQADDESLVLLDELGAGTDPTEGAALGMAILEHLHAKGAKTAATTHYSELKAFAYSRPRVANASAEFDVETLRPTYRLIVGLPGRSNAFEIAKRLGLDEPVIDRARSFISQDEMKVEDLIVNMQADKVILERERRDAQILRERAEQKVREVEKREGDLRQRERDILDRARQEASSVVSRVKREADEALKGLRSAAAAGDEKARGRAIEEARKRLRELQTEVREKTAGPAEPVPEGKGPGDLRTGEMVFSFSLRQRARVLAEPGADGKVRIQVGVIRTTVPLSDLVRVEDEDRAAERTNINQMASDKAQAISNELDLRGLTVEEAIEAVDKYLDDVSLAGLKKVFVIHGKGTGALRQAVGSHLRSHPAVKAARLGDQHEGGEGVTVAELG